MEETAPKTNPFTQSATLLQMIATVVGLVLLAGSSFYNVGRRLDHLEWVSNNDQYNTSVLSGRITAIESSYNQINVRLAHIDEKLETLLSQKGH